MATNVTFPLESLFARTKKAFSLRRRCHEVTDVVWEFSLLILLCRRRFVPVFPAGAGKPASISRCFCGANNSHDGDDCADAFSSSSSAEGSLSPSSPLGKAIVCSANITYKGKVTSVAILGGGTKMAAGAIVWNCKRKKKVCFTI